MPKRIVTTLKTVWNLIKDTIIEFLHDNAIAYSGSIAFFTLFSLPGLLIMVLLTAGYVFGEAEVKGHLFSEIRRLAGPEGAAQIQIILENVQASDYSFVATMVGLGTLMFGATTVFISMQDGLNAVWNMRPKPRRAIIKWFLNRTLSFAMVVSIGFIMMVSLVVDTILVFFHDWLVGVLTSDAVNVIEVFHFLFSVVLLTGIFAAIYKFLPHAKVGWRDILRGSTLATVLFLAGKYFIGLYLGNSSLGTAYGTAGSLVLILVWVYYSSLVLLLSAEFVDVYCKFKGRPIEPGAETVKLIVEEKEVSDL